MTRVSPAHGVHGARWAAAAFAVVAVALHLGCARPAPIAAPPDPWVARIASADAEATEGCYRCLVRALATYDAAIVAGRTALGPQAYRTAVHLALREKLVGLYPGEYQAAPARLEAVAAPEDVTAARTALAAIPWRHGTLGLGPGMTLGREDVPAVRAHYRALELRAAEDPWIATLTLAVIGSHPFLGVDEGQRPPPGVMPGLDRDTWWARHPGDATLSFMRIGILRSAPHELEAFIARHPSFVEAGILTGEAEIARGRLVSADEALAAALQELPDLVPALALRGDIRQRMEDHAEALRLYEALLVRVPDHREAQLGRMKTLGFLGQHREAIASADAMIALGTWYLGEAHYWKAWNLFTLGELEAAREAVDAARRLMVNADVHYLGGVIAFRQARTDAALADFDAAIELEGRYCEAHFDRAAIFLVRRVWPQASAGFDEAYECHAERTPTLEQRIADAREARLGDDTRKALVARRERELVAHRHQMAWARYNAAVAYANLENESIARARVEEALSLGGPAADAARDLLLQLRPR